MHIFYDPLIDLDDTEGTVLLNQEESWHCIKVLRLAAGDSIQVVNGKGGSCVARIESANARNTVLKLLSITPEIDPRNHYLHLAVAPTKNIERFEWFLEKATEIGIDEVTPVICERSERKEVKSARLIKVMIAAMKQSLKSTLPVFNEAVKLDDFIRRPAAGTQDFIAHCEESRKSAIGDHLIPGGRYRVLIGPEGDFSTSEINAAAGAGFMPVSLGKSRLRTETAALEACFEINYLNRA